MYRNRSKYDCGFVRLLLRRQFVKKLFAEGRRGMSAC